MTKEQLAEIKARHRAAVNDVTALIAALEAAQAEINRLRGHSYARLNARLTDKPVFSIGDRVRVLDVAGEYYNQIGVVIESPDDDRDYKVEFNNSPFHIDWYNEDALEPVD